MDDELARNLVMNLAKIVLSLDSDMLQVKTSLVVLKQTIANLQGCDFQSALDDFRDREEKVLKDLPSSRQLKELRELMHILEKHGGDLGKNEA